VFGATAAATSVKFVEPAIDLVAHLASTLTAAAFGPAGFSFFVEAIFIAIYLYGWDRTSSRMHLLAGIPVVIAGLTGSLFVISVNAWMNRPTGFRLEHCRAVDIDPSCCCTASSSEGGSTRARPRCTSGLPSVRHGCREGSSRSPASCSRSGRRSPS
jgi:ABC-type phosphate transport system permease subunit